MVEIDKKLLEAAAKGDWRTLDDLARYNGAMLDGTTAQGNTCLHVASICGHEQFCTKSVSLRRSLLSVTNKNDETPLLIAVKGCHGALALGLLEKHLETNQKQALSQQDKDGFNLLHHAIRSDYRRRTYGHNFYKKLALKLIEEDESGHLLRAVNKYNESPIFMAVLRGFKDVYVPLLMKLPSDESVYSGTKGYNALHAAVKYDETDFVEELVKKPPHLAKRLAISEDDYGESPMQLTAHFNRVDILDMLLRFDQSLGYHIGTTAPLVIAAFRGHVEFARKLLEYCPDAPYRRTENGQTCLHEAVLHKRTKFVEFILKDSKLWNLVNMQDHCGHTALHLAVQMCDSTMVRVLLSHPHVDVTVHDQWRAAAIWKSYVKAEEQILEVKTVNWNKIFNLIYDADPRAKRDMKNLYEDIKNKVIDHSKKDIKSLTETYTNNTSVVAILMASVTFAAAFALPGGYSSVAGIEGLATLARKPSFQAFLISDAIGMCSSLAVSFLCIKIRSMDYEFFIRHRHVTNCLMWVAYIATAIAFATGLYTVVGPRVLWLAITICVLAVVFPNVMVLIGEWPIMKLRRKAFDSNFLDMA